MPVSNFGTRWCAAAQAGVVGIAAAWLCVVTAALSFVRAKNGDKVFALFNLSGEAQTVGFTDGPSDGAYTDFADGSPLTVTRATSIKLAPWSYRLLATR